MERILFWGGGWEGEVGAERDLGPGGRAEEGGQREFNFSGTEAKGGRSRFCRSCFACGGISYVTECVLALWCITITKDVPLKSDIMV